MALGVHSLDAIAVDLSSPEESQAATDSGWPFSQTVPDAVDDRADHGLATELSAARRAVRTRSEKVPGVRSAGLSAQGPQAFEARMKPLLVHGPHAEVDHFAVAHQCNAALAAQVIPAL
jgi:hypothetical protein